jgi:hypothetical protein
MSAPLKGRCNLPFCTAARIAVMVSPARVSFDLIIREAILAGWEPRMKSATLEPQPGRSSSRKRG